MMSEPPHCSLVRFINGAFSPSGWQRLHLSV
ncbi:MAG: hypothetical protein ACJASX_003263, partial [Limisphaerales bacterium]